MSRKKGKGYAGNTSSSNRPSIGLRSGGGGLRTMAKILKQRYSPSHHNQSLLSNTKSMRRKRPSLWKVPATSAFFVQQSATAILKVCKMLFLKTNKSASSRYSHCTRGRVQTYTSQIKPGSVNKFPECLLVVWFGLVFGCEERLEVCKVATNLEFVKRILQAMRSHRLYHHQQHLKIDERWL